MEKELIDLFDSAKKAADAAATTDDGGSEVSRCVDALKLLKTFPITYDILLSTQVGKKVRPLSKHPNEKIQTMASELLDIWKKIVIEETTRKKKKGIVDNKADIVKVEKRENSSAVKIEKVSTTGSVKIEKHDNSSAVKHEKVSNAGSVKVEKHDNSSAVKLEKVSNTGSVKVEKHDNSSAVKLEKVSVAGSVKVEKILKGESATHMSSSKLETGKAEKKPFIAPPKLTTMVKCNDPLRDKFREILVDSLSKVINEVDEETREEASLCDPMRVAVSVETEMFEKLGRSNGGHKAKYRSIMFNMKDANNPDFRRKVLLGQVKPEWIIDMTPEEMASDERQRENMKMREKALFEAQRGLKD
ncbi:hypothetical protein ACFE04_002819 [Oxalis oulophora]